MTDKQPEALRLAAALDSDATNGDMGRKPDPKCKKRKAAEELRRQHQEIQELKRTKEELLEFAQRLGDVPCPLEVYEWLCKNNILDVRKAVIAKYKD